MATIARITLKRRNYAHDVWEATTMAPEEQDLRFIVERLQKVEKENRALKRFGLGFILLIGAAVTMGQARPSRTAEAEQFVVKDPQGRMRAMLGFSRGAPMLDFYDNAGVLRESLMVGANGIPGLTLFDAAGNQTVGLAGLENGPSLGLTEGADRSLSLQELTKQPGIDLHVGKDQIGLMVEDRDGFSAVLGSADLVTPRTGETHRTSAASVVLFDKDRNVIWSAP